MIEKMESDYIVAIAFVFVNVLLHESCERTKSNITDVDDGDF